MKSNQLGHDEVVEILLQNGANVDPKDINGIIPLHCAAENGNVVTNHFKNACSKRNKICLYQVIKRLLIY